jgi:hypothetical protein
MNKLIASTAATLAVAFASTLPVGTAQAETYWKCGSGEFRLNAAKNGAHCFKAGSNNDVTINCPQAPVPMSNKKIGTFPKAKSGKDTCEVKIDLPGGGENTLVLDPLPCSAGYDYAQNASGNTDKCRKTNPPTISKPDQSFTSTP